jgi:hypothetical protein
MFDHEQRRRPVAELFAPVHADVDAQLAAARTDALGLGQLVVAGLARQVVRQTAASVWPASPLGLRRRFSWRHGRALARARLNEEEELVGIYAFAARPVKAL